MVALVLLLYITTVYRTMLLSWERARTARAAAATAAAAAAAAAAGGGGGGGGPIPTGTGTVPGEERGVNTAPGPREAMFLAVAVGALATFVGAGSGLSALAAGFMGVLAAAVPPLLNGRDLPPLAQDW